MITALANSLWRIRSANRRGPHLTRRGPSGAQAGNFLRKRIGGIRDRWCILAAILQRAMPNMLVVVLQILR